MQPVYPAGPTGEQLWMPVRPTRSMLRVTLPQEYEERHLVKDLVDRLMGKHPEHRFQFIQANAATLDEAAIDA